jgi:hypothetical protein
MFVAFSQGFGVALRMNRDVAAAVVVPAAEVQMRCQGRQADGCQVGSKKQKWDLGRRGLCWKVVEEIAEWTGRRRRMGWLISVTGGFGLPLRPI